MTKVRWFRIVLLMAMLLAVTPVAAKVPDQDDGLNSAIEGAVDGWYIVQFEAPPLATKAESLGAMSMMITGGRLNVNTAASRAYVADLKNEQAQFKLELTQAIPNAQVGREFQVVLNAVAVKLSDASVDAVRSLRFMPGVKSVTPQVIYTVDMDYSLPLIEAPALWSELGGQESAGEGVKVAVIDTGIDPSHDMFDGTDFDYPAMGTWPKGYCADRDFCNGKIIAARFYTPTFDVHPDETLSPLDLNGHGTHVAGTAAGNVVTATYGTETTQISGVAPGAWLMTYKGLYQTPSGNGSGSNIMLAGAIEDAVADGADVINNSWGSDAFVMPANDPLAQAYEAAVDAGVVIVFSAGNSGPGYNTVGSPTSRKFIMVGASTTERAFYNTLSVTAPEPVTPTLQSFPGNQFAELASTAFPSGPIGPLPYIPCDLLGLPDTTLAGVMAGITQTAPYIGGWIALIPRGDYNFTVKLDNAIAQGASAIAMYTDAGRTWKGGFTASGRDIYSVMFANDLGLEMRDWWSVYTDTARFEIGYPVTAWTVETPNVIAEFSSRGPDASLDLSPDVVAPGVNILSAQPNGLFAPFGGTSMAAPHVTGAAALLLAANPDWTPAQVRSALMSTADQVILDTDEATLADVMTQGAGLIDLSQAADAGLTFDNPSASFRTLPQGSTASVTIEATEVAGTVETYTLSIDEWVAATGEVTVSLSTNTLAMTLGGSETFTVTVEAGPTASLMDLEGNIIISGTEHFAHVPYWVRVTPAAVGEVLLVDFDLNEFAVGGDYQGYYTRTLENLGVAYDIWDIGGLGGYYPSRAELDQYDKVVVFTGDNYQYWLDPIADDIRMYLAMGGKMLITGQDALGIDGLAGFPFMRGADNIPLRDGTTPIAVGIADYNPFLKDMIFRADGGDGAGNQSYVDELDWLNYSDLDTAPLFEVPNLVPAVADGVIATRSSWEPTIERIQNPLQYEEYSWRVAFLGFGLEGVDNAGPNTREELAGVLFDWMDDGVTVAFDQPAYAASKTLEFIQFSATMSATIGTEAQYYAWDFGDGSGIEYTAGRTVQHQYLLPGYYTAYVEVMDEYAHKAVGTPVVVEVGSHFYLPIVAKMP